MLLSTSYLDEAERCGHVVVLHEGKVLAQGPPSEVSALARGRTFLADAARRARPRAVLQARLLDEPGGGRRRARGRPRADRAPAPTEPDGAAGAA